MLHHLKDIIDATGGTCSAVDDVCTGISIDTRTIALGNAYVAIVGEQMDGHNFVTQAIEKGASFVIVDHYCDEVAKSKQIIVADTLIALQDWARHYRDRADFRVIGITGSVGKTSAKDMIAHILSSQARCYATKGNYNNHIGLPLTLLNAPSDMDYVVLEMGMNHAGEIALLSHIASPDAALITTIDAVHLEFFDSVADIARAKAEIVQGMAHESPVILPMDTPYYDILLNAAQEQECTAISFGTHADAQYHIDTVTLDAPNTVARYVVGDTAIRVTIGCMGKHYAYNASAALALCDALQLDLASCAASLQHLHESDGRGTMVDLPWGQGHITLIDETYNASPIAMRAAFEKARDVALNRRVIAVLGDMLELGNASAALHAELASSLQAQDIEHVFTTGDLMRHLSDAMDHAQHFEGKDTLNAALVRALQPDDVVLVKGSRGSAMEQIIDYITAQSCAA